MQVIFENNLFKVLDKSVCVKESKYDDTIVAFLESNNCDVEYDESTIQVAKLHKRMEKRSQKRLCLNNPSEDAVKSTDTQDENCPGEVQFRYICDDGTSILIIHPEMETSYHES